MVEKIAIISTAISFYWCFGLMIEMIFSIIMGDNVDKDLPSVRYADKLIFKYDSFIMFLVIGFFIGCKGWFVPFEYWYFKRKRLKAEYLEMIKHDVHLMRKHKIKGIL